MKIKIPEKIIGSALFTGYIPFASGTFGSLLALFIYLIPGFDKPDIIIPMILIFIIIGVRIGDKFELVYGKDPRQCTIDEVVGTWISLLFCEKKAANLIITFVIWRIFDIIKVYPADKMEQIKGGWGIMLDDIVSGIYSLITVQLIFSIMKIFNL